MSGTADGRLVVHAWLSVPKILAGIVVAFVVVICLGTGAENVVKALVGAGDSAPGAGGALIVVGLVIAAAFTGILRLLRRQIAVLDPGGIVISGLDPQVVSLRWSEVRQVSLVVRGARRQWDVPEMSFHMSYPYAPTLDFRPGVRPKPARVLAYIATVAPQVAIDDRGRLAAPPLGRHGAV
ncbi:hypothetical protein MYK68_18145 [Gordonia sp. PP30]|uniref:hypothetical protein n=1 Tax=Gordonia sp. PP30 TaxID=2935861 RepID=UPI002000487A|nr:hypothetical protein [Gordonia sp. PP30]UQE74611.1 hypothetical protein MYK68_18145 [Gordonia sp. PP30]